MKKPAAPLESKVTDLATFMALAKEVPASVIDQLFIDLDGVTADFEAEVKVSNHPEGKAKLYPGWYLWLPPIPGAIESIRILRKAFPERVWFLTKPPKFSPYAYVEKALWVQRYFGDDGLHSLIVAQDKSLLGTADSLLIDDRPHKGGVDRFRGTVLHFGQPINTQVERSSLIPVPDWKETLIMIAGLIKRRT